MSEVQGVYAWPTNAAMIADVARLGYLQGTVLDATFGKHGGFWKEWRPAELTTNDLHHPADHDWDFLAMPIADGTFDVVVFDPDYKLNGTPALGEMDERYGVAENLTRTERLEKIRLGTIECYRVCRKRLLVKCMDQVEGGQVRWQTDMVTRAVEELGGRKVDRFDLVGGNRSQPKNRTKKHAACKGLGCVACIAGREPSVQATASRNCSTLLVFAKPSSNRTKQTERLL